MSFYYSIVLAAKGYDRIWTIEKFENGNHLHSIHRSWKLCFETVEACEVELIKRVRKFGGSYLERKKIPLNSIPRKRTHY